MKTKIRNASSQSFTRLALAIGGVGVALASATALADRGRGSIRAVARVEPPHREVRPEPEPRRDVRPEPVREPVRVEPARRDWDAGDEDGRHFGGFDHPVPPRIFRGSRVRILPERHRDLLWQNLHYYIDDVGAYYLLQPDGQYLVVQPPVGVVVPSLVEGTMPIVVGPTTYYYLDGVFYVAQPGGYVVVNPPPGVVVPALPSGAVQTIINSTVVYQFNGFNYTPMLQGGVTVYAVTPV